MRSDWVAELRSALEVQVDYVSVLILSFASTSDN